MQLNHTKFKTNLIIFLLGLKSLCACVNTKQGLGANKEDTINPLVNTKPDNLNHTSGICNKKTCFYCKNDHKHSSCNPYNCYYGHHKYFSYTRDFCWGTTKRKIVSTGTGLLSLMIATAPTIYYACAHNIDALKIGSSLMQHTYNQPAFLSSGSSSMENITGDALVYVMTTALPTLGTIAAFLPNQLNTNRVTNAEPVERLQPIAATNHTIDLLDNEISGELQAESMSLDSVMKYINEGRVSVNAIPRDSSETRYNLLQYATYGERLDVVEFLITKGADINAQSPGQKVTALHLAAYTRNFDIVDYLLKHGANPCLRDSMNLTASQIASEVAGNQSVVRLLQAAEKKCRAAFLPNQLNTNRVTNAEPVERLQPTEATNHTIDLLDNEISAELQAESMSLDSVMKYINEGRVSVNAIPRDSSENRYNLLQYAAYGERLDVVEFLITKGADINAQSPGQKVTALHLAAYTRNFDIVDYLLKHGANPCLRDSMNLTASQIASEVARNQSVVRLLQAAEKKWRQEQKS